jgi:hypothetical protein
MQVEARAIVVAAALSTVLTLTACGGKSEPESGKADKPETTETSTVAPASDALVRVSCVPDSQGEGVWSATGTLKNRTKRVQSYDVIVQVGPANGQESTAVVERVSKVAAGKSAEFTVTGIQPATPTGPCHIQVRVAKPGED